MKVIKTYTVDNTEKLKDINLDIDDSQIKLLESKDNNIYITIKSNKNIKSEDYIKLDQDDTTVEISSKKNTRIHFLKNTTNQIEIQIPKSYTQNISIKTDIGDITSNKNLNLNNFNITSNIGDIELNKKIKCQRFNIVNDTGDIDIKNIDGSGSIKSDVGDIECDITGINQDININSDIGDVDLGIARDLSFKFDSSKNPDEIDINFNNISKNGESFYGEYGENPKYTIKAVSDIGNVKIEYR